MGHTVNLTSEFRDTGGPCRNSKLGSIKSPGCLLATGNGLGPLNKLRRPRKTRIQPQCL